MAGIITSGPGDDGGSSDPVVVVLTPGATPALDASLGDVFTLAAVGNYTIAVPTNPTAGQRIVIAHTASGGDRTLSLNSGAGGFRFVNGLTELPTTLSGETDYSVHIWNATDSFWDVVACASTTPAAAGLVRLDEKSGAAASYSFTSIAGTYRHLVIHFAGRTDGANPAYDLRIQFNGDTGGNYDSRTLTDATAATGAAAVSGNVGVLLGAGADRANAFSNAEITIPDYANASREKTCHAKGGCPAGGGGGPYVFSSFVSYRSTTAISRVDIFPSAGSFTADCVATLYGLT